MLSRVMCAAVNISHDDRWIGGSLAGGVAMEQLALSVRVAWQACMAAIHVDTVTAEVEPVHASIGLCNARGSF